METDFHTKSRLSLAGWGTLWYENRANLSSSGCCHVFILPTRCPFINLWLALALCLKRLVLNWLILDCCCCGSEKTRSVSHRSFKVLNRTTETLCNPRLAAGAGCTPLHPQWQGNKLSKLHKMLDDWSLYNSKDPVLISDSKFWSWLIMTKTQHVTTIF